MSAVIAVAMVTGFTWCMYVFQAISESNLDNNHSAILKQPSNFLHLKKYICAKAMLAGTHLFFKF